MWPFKSKRKVKLKKGKPCPDACAPVQEEVLLHNIKLKLKDYEKTQGPSNFSGPRPLYGSDPFLLDDHDLIEYE